MRDANPHNMPKQGKEKLEMSFKEVILKSTRSAEDRASGTRSINVEVSSLFDQDYAGQYMAALVSPEGGVYNHPVAIRVNRGGEITEVTQQGTRVYAGGVAGRGVRVEIDFDPEDADDPWTLAFYFHKGHTYVEVLQRRGDERTHAAIWRC